MCNSRKKSWQLDCSFGTEKNPLLSERRDITQGCEWGKKKNPSLGKLAGRHLVLFSRRCESWYVQEKKRGGVSMLLGGGEREGNGKATRMWGGEGVG